MTENKLQKRVIRQRMDETGEKYTAARRALQNQAAGPRELRHLSGPGTVIAIVSGGGATNLALAIPVLAQHLDAGGHLVVAQYGDDALALPNALDLVVARGIATVAQLTAWLESEDEKRLRDVIEVAVSGVKVFKGPTTPTILAEALNAGPNPLLYIQDVQTDPPLQPQARGQRLDEYQLVPENVRAIRGVIEEVGGKALVGHCIPADDIESWEPIAEACDYTLAIEHDYIRFDQDDADRIAATIEVFDSDGPLEPYETVIDTGFLRWRNVWLP